MTDQKSKTNSSSSYGPPPAIAGEETNWGIFTKYKITGSISHGPFTFSQAYAKYLLDAYYENHDSVDIQDMWIQQEGGLVIINPTASKTNSSSSYGPPLAIAGEETNWGIFTKYKITGSISHGPFTFSQAYAKYLLDAYYENHDSVDIQDMWIQQEGGLVIINPTAKLLCFRK